MLLPLPKLPAPPASHNPRALPVPQYLTERVSWEDILPFNITGFAGEQRHFPCVARTDPSNLMRLSPFVLLLILFASVRATAQDPVTAPAPVHVHGAAPGPAVDSAAWTWSPDANLFFGYNYQQREFRDQSAWESQNWFMLHGERPLGRGALRLESMLSLEPFTMHGIGSPQLFQTGESYQMGPLIDRQHPHDLFMELGATYRLRGPRATIIMSADLVGPAALGPTPFMHRDSARNNPQAPLSHHQLDSTHISPGVLTGGIEASPLTLLGSWFRGQEPDEYR